MAEPSYSLRSLFLVLSIVALGAGALKYANLWWESVSCTLVAFAVAYGAIRGVLWRKPFWLAFALTTIIVVYFSINFVGVLPFVAYYTYLSPILAEGAPLNVNRRDYLNRIGMLEISAACGLVMGLWAETMARNTRESSEAALDDTESGKNAP
jgi:hypothetical protein